MNHSHLKYFVEVESTEIKKEVYNYFKKEAKEIIKSEGINLEDNFYILRFSCSTSGNPLGSYETDLKTSSVADMYLLRDKRGGVKIETSLIVGSHNRRKLKNLKYIEYPITNRYVVSEERFNEEKAKSNKN